MSDKKNPNQKSELDFTTNSLFKKSIKKSKWKQFILYCVISVSVLGLGMLVIHGGSQYLINKKIQNEESQEQIQKDKYQQGAAISESKKRYYHNLFSTLEETTFYKKVGNRKIIWETITKKYPAIGSVEVLERGSGTTQDYEKDKDTSRAVRYNQLNNWRMIDFYLPNLSYDYLPQELDIATGLDKNTLVEVALSFKKSMKPEELAEKLRYENVDWVWVNMNSRKQSKELAKKWEKDRLKVIQGEKAYGFSVSEKYPYDENMNEDITINGAVVSGTPTELERFQNLGILRASVIGVTIDKY